MFVVLLFSLRRDVTFDIKIKRQKEKELLVFALCCFCLVGSFVRLKKKAFLDCVFGKDCELKGSMFLPTGNE